MPSAKVGDQAAEPDAPPLERTFQEKRLGYPVCHVGLRERLDVRFLEGRAVYGTGYRAGEREDEAVGGRIADHLDRLSAAERERSVEGDKCVTPVRHLEQGVARLPDRHQPSSGFVAAEPR